MEKNYTEIDEPFDFIFWLSNLKQVSVCSLKDPGNKRISWPGVNRNIQHWMSLHSPINVKILYYKLEFFSPNHSGYQPWKAYREEPFISNQVQQSYVSSGMPNATDAQREKSCSKDKTLIDLLWKIRVVTIILRYPIPTQTSREVLKNPDFDLDHQDSPSCGHNVIKINVWLFVGHVCKALLWCTWRKQNTGFPLIREFREIRENFEDFFQSGKSGKNRGFSAKIREKIFKSGNFFSKSFPTF